MAIVVERNVIIPSSETELEVSEEKNEYKEMDETVTLNKKTN